MTLTPEAPREDGPRQGGDPATVPEPGTMGDVGRARIAEAIEVLREKDPFWAAVAEQMEFRTQLSSRVGDIALNAEGKLIANEGFILEAPVEDIAYELAAKSIYYTGDSFGRGVGKGRLSWNFALQLESSEMLRKQFPWQAKLARDHYFLEPIHVSSGVIAEDVYDEVRERLDHPEVEIEEDQVVGNEAGAARRKTVEAALARAPMSPETEGWATRLGVIESRKKKRTR